MRSQFSARLLALAALSGIAMLALPASAQRDRDELREPVYRVSRTEEGAGEPAHPLDPALELAHRGLAHIRADIQDYTATMYKRERIDGDLKPYERMFVKVRCRKVHEGKIVAPLSVYMQYEKPTEMAGREVIYVENRNGGKLLGHEVPGIKNLFTVELDPLGSFAMNGNRYPITEVGIENLTSKLIEKGSRDRRNGAPEDCIVRFQKGTKINDRPCMMLEVIHPVERPQFEFYRARIFIDDEYQVPVRYSAWTWPAKSGGDPVLEEEYTYTNLKLNVGLTDRDFDHANTAYKFPNRVFRGLR